MIHNNFFNELFCNKTAYWWTNMDTGHGLVPNERELLLADRDQSAYRRLFNQSTVYFYPITVYFHQITV